MNLINKNIAILIVGLLLTSCSLTNKMWKDSRYEESISSFLITQNGGNLIIIGDKYHYIFPVTNRLKTILLSDKRQFITPRFYGFEIDRNNNISGKFYLNFSIKHQKDHITWLNNSGFIFKSKYSRSKKQYTFTDNIKGKRYSADKLINSRYKFKKPYSLSIREETTLLGKIGKILSTPITVAADGALFMGAMALIFVSYEAALVTGKLKH